MLEPRLKSVKKSLVLNRIEGLIVSSAVNIAYLTGYSNFSTHEREAYLFITESNAALFTDGRYIEAVRKMLPKSVKVLLHTELYKEIKGSKAKSIGVENNFTLAEFKKFKKETRKTFVLTRSIIENLRATKDSEEIKNIRAACRLTDRTYEVVRTLIQLGVTEKEIALRIEYFIKDNGGELAFDSIVAFGENSAIPHHQTSNKKFSKSDQFVLLDFGAKVAGYSSDMTRTILTSRANKKAHEMYEAVFDAQKAAIDYIKSNPNPKTKSAADIANKHITSKGFEEIPHGLGHGIGLEVHEGPSLSPISQNKLAKNNVFTIEPGIYIPGFGGVRIEDDFLLSDKLERLTKSPKGLNL